MKRLSILFGIVLSITSFLISCEDADFLSKPPYSFTSPENFYKTESDLKIALVGCYSTINTKNVPGEYVPDGTYDRGLLYILQGVDEMLPNTADASGDFVRLSYTPSGPAGDYLSNYWAAFFAGINRCNLLLEKAPEVEMDPAMREQIMGEARFLRAFFYFHLATGFGAIPLTTSSVPNNDAPRNSLQEVYALIMEDLEYAYGILKETAINTGGANKWTAGGYLGVVYNHLASSKRYGVGRSLNFELNSFEWVDADEMSQKAVDVLNDVVDNSSYSLVDGAKYSYLFRESTKAEQYKENLFAAENSNAISNAYTELVHFPIPNGNRNLYGGGYGRLRPTRELYLSYDENDIRRDHNVTGSYPGTAPTTENIEGDSYYIPDPAGPATTRVQWCTGKFRMQNPNEKVIPNHATSLNFPLLRFADVLLQYAEALYFTGDEPQARSILTTIRSRVAKPEVDIAGLNAAYYKADFVEELLDERRRELCFESKRRNDLIRFNKLEEAILSINPNAGNLNDQIIEVKFNYAYFKIWFPIPLTQIDLNQNLLPQNVGY